MKTIVDEDFGICPRCGARLIYLLSTYQLGIPDAGGRHLSRIIGEDRDITGACPNCEHKVPLTSSVYGITTRDYEPLVSDQNAVSQARGINLIGYVDKRGVS